MKVAIPVEIKSQTGNVCPSFGRAPFYLVFNSEDGSINYIENTAAAASGGAGIKAAQLLADASIDAVATPRCGTNAAEVLEGANVKIYRTSGDDLKENMDKISENGLEILNNFHAGFHGHGGN